jgi:hypothetical protein
MAGVSHWYPAKAVIGDLAISRDTSERLQPYIPHSAKSHFLLGRIRHRQHRKLGRGKHSKGHRQLDEGQVKRTARCAIQTVSEATDTTDTTCAVPPCQAAPEAMGALIHAAVVVLFLDTSQLDWETE